MHQAAALTGRERRLALWAVGPPGVFVPYDRNQGSPGTGLHLSPGLPTWVLFLGCLGVSRSHTAAHLFALRLSSVTWCSVSCPGNGDADTHSPRFLGK